MDPFVVVVIVAIGLVVLAGWLLLRRRPAAPDGDEWSLPAQDRTATPAEPVRQVLTRDALVNPDRRLDVSKWDNSPDVGTEEVEGDLPTHFDREYLRRRQDE